MNKVVVTILFTISLVLSSFLTAIYYDFVNVERVDRVNQISISEMGIIRFINEERLKFGLSELSYNGELHNSATMKANDMCVNQYFAHKSPDGVFFDSLLSVAGYEYDFGGENLAREFNSSKIIVKAWMASPSHRDNILEARFEDVGIGICNDIVVAHFGVEK